VNIGDEEKGQSREKGKMARRLRILALLGFGLRLGVGVAQAAEIPLPSYHYGARIPVSCLNRSMWVGSFLFSLWRWGRERKERKEAWVEGEEDLEIGRRSNKRLLAGRWTGELLRWVQLANHSCAGK
jgi:hypothetical protein